MKGKDKCKILKEIRAQIAAANEIEWVTDNCSHKGECRGTCPKCEAEIAALEKALERRRALGKTVAVAGLSAGIVVSSAMTSSCALRPTQTTDGDMVAPHERVVNSTGKDALSGGTEQTSTTVTDMIDGDLTEIIELMGEPLPVYYLTDFTMYDSKRIFEATQEFNLYDVVEGEEGPSGVLASVAEGDTFTLLGHNGIDEYEAYSYLVRYQDVLYAMDAYELEQFATEIVATEDGKAE